MILVKISLAYVCMYSLLWGRYRHIYILHICNRYCSNKVLALKCRNNYIDTYISLFYYCFFVLLHIDAILPTRPIIWYLQLLQTCHASWCLLPGVAVLTWLNCKIFLSWPRTSLTITWHPAGRVGSSMPPFAKILEFKMFSYVTPPRTLFATGNAWRQSIWSFTSRLTP